MGLKDLLIVFAVIFLFWLVFGGMSSSNNMDYAPDGIEDYNAPPSYLH